MNREQCLRGRKEDQDDFLKRNQIVTEEDYLNYYKKVMRFALSYKKEQLWQDAKGILEITVGNYAYQSFDICFLNDMLSQILQALYEGYIPCIHLRGRSLGDNDWSNWFYQPFEEMGERKHLPWTRMDSRLVTFWGPGFETPYRAGELAVATRLYRDWAVIKDEEFNRIAQKYKADFQGKKVLGVLVRGTDYIELEPANHPRQPKLETVLKDTKEWMEEGHYDACYVCSEERRIVERFEEVFPGRVITSGQQYVDDIFYQENQLHKGIWLEDIERKDPRSREEKGRQYLITIFLLSLCKGLLAGNCGGSCAALFWNDSQYEKVNLYNLGFYKGRDTII